MHPMVFFLLRSGSLYPILFKSNYQDYGKKIDTVSRKKVKISYEERKKKVIKGRQRERKNDLFLSAHNVATIED